MPQVTGYHRPSSLEDALAALAVPGRVVLGGGTELNAAEGGPVEVVDLQALGLDGIALDGDRLRIGATTTLSDLAADPRTPEALARLARAEAPSTLRAMGTVGGVVATADPESELLAGLLVYGATVTTVGASGTSSAPLADILGSGPGDTIITAVHIDTGGVAAVARTARTPGDRPIVAAVARRDDETTLLALCGVAATPVLVDDPAAVDPPGDFRGSTEYRRHLAAVLAARALAEVAT